MTSQEPPESVEAVPRRRRRWLWWFALFFAIGLGGPATCALSHNYGPREIDRISGERPSRPRGARQVVLFVLDGLAPRHLAEATTPVLDELATAGWVAVAARTRESATNPAIGTMVSGLPPATHEFGGCFYSASKRFEHDTIYSVCRREELRCAFFTCKPKLATLVRDEEGAELYLASRTDQETLDAAARYLDEEDGDFALVHLCGPDRTGHNFGWGSRRQLRRIAEIDGQIGRFLTTLDASPDARPLAIQLVSDHGGSGRTHHSPGDENRAVVWMLSGDGVAPGSTDDEVWLIDVAPTTVALLGLEVPRPWWGKPSRALDAPGGPPGESQLTGGPGRLESQTVR